MYFVILLCCIHTLVILLLRMLCTCDFMNALSEMTKQNCEIEIKIIEFDFRHVGHFDSEF